MKMLMEIIMDIKMINMVISQVIIKIFISIMSFYDLKVVTISPNEFLELREQLF